jgi:hypothetical protein
VFYVNEAMPEAIMVSPHVHFASVGAINE